MSNTILVQKIKSLLFVTLASHNDFAKQPGLLTAGLPDLAFLMPNFTNLAFLKAVDVKKNCMAFSFLYLAFIRSSWHILSDWRFSF